MTTAGRRRSGRIFILIALFLIIILAIAAFAMRQMLFGGPGPQQGEAVALMTPTPVQNMVDIFVIVADIPRGTKLSPDMVGEGKQIILVKYPQAELLEGLFITNPADLENKYAKYELVNGMPLTRALLSDVPVGSEAAQRVKKGKVAISIPITRLTSVSYALKAGDHVNVITSLLFTDLDANFQTRLPNTVGAVVLPGPQSTSPDQPAQNTATISIIPGTTVQGRAELDPSLNQPVYVFPSEPIQRPRLVSQTLISDAEVLWVGTFPEDGKLIEGPQPTPTPLPQGQQAPPPAAVPYKPDIITIVVNPQDAVTLNHLLLIGAKLNLVLRNPAETDPLSTEAVTLQFILDRYQIPNPAKLPYGIEPRIDQMAYPTLPNDQ